jgi:membrane protease YdiL (CAAX protease family)
MNNITEAPSLKITVIIILIYLFAVIPLTLAIAYGGTIVGYSLYEIKNYLSEIILIIHVGIICSLVYLLLRKYSGYLLSPVWKNNFSLYISVGFKWGLPLLILHIILFSFPTIRENLISRSTSTRIITIEGASFFLLSVYSSWLILGAIIEEFIFRGIILNKIKNFITEKKAIIVSALVFALVHFIYSPIYIGELTSHFFVGILCGFAYISTRSCISAIIPHLINNTIYVGYAWLLIK